MTVRRLKHDFPSGICRDSELLDTNGDGARTRHTLLLGTGLAVFGLVRRRVRK